MSENPCVARAEVYAKCSYKYLNGITTVSSEIVTRKMNNEPYRSLDVVDYYGIVCSVPEYLAPNKNDGPGVEYRQVYVKEYWKGQIFDMQFTLRSLDGHIWEIEEIEDTSFVFNQ